MSLVTATSDGVSRTTTSGHSTIKGPAPDSGIGEPKAMGTNSPEPATPNDRCFCGKRMLNFNCDLGTCAGCKALSRKTITTEVGTALDVVPKRGASSPGRANLTLELDPTMGNNSRANGNDYATLSGSISCTDAVADGRFERGDCNTSLTQISLSSFKSTVKTSNNTELAGPQMSPVNESLRTAAESTKHMGPLLTSNSRGMKEDEGNSKNEETQREPCSIHPHPKRQRTDFSIIDQHCSPLNTLSTSSESDEDSSETSDLDWFAPPLFSSSSMALKFVKMEELLLASEHSNQKMDPPPPLQGYFPDELTVTDLYNLNVHLFTRSINQHRRLMPFKLLSKHDQLVLMRASMSEVVLTRVSIMYNRRISQTFVDYPGGSTVSAGVTKVYGNEMHRGLLELKHSFPEQLRNDTILVLLCAIVFFNPAYAELKNKTAVDEERELYLQILKEYLKSTFGEAEGRRGFGCLLTWLHSVSTSVCMQKRPMSYDIDAATLGISNFSLHGVTDKLNGE